ncbi:hypothetical protein [Xylophilus ampelinus]|uniref:Uncharacterized protein n=1 Tax=Xylophilus ampelinus TaxID=54067 RepID=A0A318SCZ9_9BURK|nr:hypothetical protein [Xylophilus ampelinus]MCS4511861.1 hypothetical protein [Xylophilus ampelinus]PYE73335.1 hypothetical protein DFQ15_1397 [Xylophilus ampelinus]
MRTPFGLIGLVLALLIVALLAKKALLPQAGTPSVAGTSHGAAATTDVRARSAEVQQQVRKDLDDAAEAARRQREAADQ